MPYDEMPSLLCAGSRRETALTKRVWLQIFERLEQHLTPSSDLYVVNALCGQFLRGKPQRPATNTRGCGAPCWGARYEEDWPAHEFCEQVGACGGNSGLRSIDFDLAESRMKGEL